MDDPDDVSVLRYTVDTRPASYHAYDEEDEGPFDYEGPFVGNATATRFTVGPGVTEIGEGTFAYCSGLTSLQGMGKGVTKIGELAFYHSGLVTLQGMGKNVTEIGKSAFYSCSALTSLRGIPESVTVISLQAFCCCSGLTSLEGLPGNLTAIVSNAVDGDIERGVFGECHSLTSLQGLSKNITELGRYCFSHCTGITSLQGGECVTVLGNLAFRSCGALTTLQGLSRNVTAVGDPSDTASYASTFYGCTSLVSIGPGFSPSCFVHPNTFDRCPALLAAAKAKGFASAIAWGRHRWLAHPTSRRFTVLTAVRQVRRSPPSANLPSPLLSLLAGAPDDMVRVIVGFMGEGAEESAQEKEARWELTAFKQSREIGLQREQVERLEEGLAQQREQIEELKEQMEQQREQMEERMEQQREQAEQQRGQIEELLRREVEECGEDEGDRRVRQKRED